MIGMEPKGLAAILVVDDDRDFLKETMEGLNLPENFPDYNIIGAKDGNEAVISYQINDPKVIILDMMLPKRSGFMVFEKLNRDYKERDQQRPGVIMVTANLGLRHRHYAQSLGVDDYFTKPFNFEKLVWAVRDCLSRK